jgi:hypothetical protein
VLLVTHSLEHVTRFCDEALWLDAGAVRAQGDPKRVVDAYLMDVARSEDAALARQEATGLEARSVEPDEPAPPDLPDPESREPPPGSQPTSQEPEDMFRAVEGRWGTREAEIVGVDLLRADGTPAHVFGTAESVDIRLRVRAHQPLTDFVFGVAIFNTEGVCCYGTNTDIDGATPAELRGDGEVVFHLERLDLIDGAYKLDVAVHRQTGAPYDYHRLLHTFRVASRMRDSGIFRPAHRWTFGGGVRMTGP